MIVSPTGKQKEIKWNRREEINVSAQTKSGHVCMSSDDIPSQRYQFNPFSINSSAPVIQARLLNSKGPQPP